MAFHDDLLQQAIQLVNTEPENPTQASLRRAVSTAHYALFHLLISESVASWSKHYLSAGLDRAFDHATMKSASNRILNRLVFPFVDEDIEVVANLRVVAKAFAQLQAKRHTADYDNITFWTRKEALEQVKLAQQAFVKWNLIRDEDIARTFLISLLAKSRG